MASGGLERWRELFRGSGADIFAVIEHAILVAASDSPQELRRRRDRIAETLYTALAPPPGCPGCGGGAASPEEGNGSVRRVAAEKESKVESSNGALGEDEDEDDDGSDDERLRRAAASNYGQGYDDDGEEGEEEGHVAEETQLEALTNEIEEETQVVGEVLRIKELVMNHEDQSDGILFESLRRLQLMQLSVDTLKATEIGRAVNGLRKHNLQKIRHLVHTLIEGWKVLVNEWVSATNAAIADTSPNCSNPSIVDDEEGLPSPPLDEGAFLATQTTSIQLSEIFDGMDDDGNLRNNNNGGSGNKREKNGGRPLNNASVTKQQRPLPLPDADEKIRYVRHEVPTSQGSSMRQINTQKDKGSNSQVKPNGMLKKESKPLSGESGPGRPFKAALQQKPYSEMKPRQTGDPVAAGRKPVASHVGKSRIPAQASAGAKMELVTRKPRESFLEENRALEVAKRKLHERYQEAENAKRQRTIQVMELNDIPKPKHQNRHPVMKSRNHIRNWANGRR